MALRLGDVRPGSRRHHLRLLCRRTLLRAHIRESEPERNHTADLHLRAVQFSDAGKSLPPAE